MSAALPKPGVLRPHSIPQRIKRLHLVGIGGTGMCGIAEVLLSMGFEITGSDLVATDVTDRLLSLGARVRVGHAAEAVGDAQLVVISSAVQPDNPEVVEARQRGLPVIRRAEMLAELMRLRWGIAVCGTHGKSTVTSMIGEVLTAAGFDPTIIVGGRLTGSNTGARVGQGEILVAEADEYDQSFLQLQPIMSVVTNIEPEHLECYGSFADLLGAFRRFLRSVPFYGRVIMSGDDHNLRQLKPDLERPITVYGFNPGAELSAEVQSSSGLTTHSRVSRQGKVLGTLDLKLPGAHNVHNALGALAVAFELGVEWPVAKAALEQFTGVRRRFEVVGEFGGVMLVDDYAHHPTEVRTTLTAARAGFPERRLVALIQPHLYSRAQRFAEEFGEALLVADVVIATDIYGSREAPIQGVTGQLIVDACLRRGAREVHYIPAKSELPARVPSILRPGDLLVTLGAGDIGRIGRAIFGVAEARA
jgi:UDP-N-acetylmuramate--alanine ligase